jgi:hypothetical protein
MQVRRGKYEALREQQFLLRGLLASVARDPEQMDHPLHVPLPLHLSPARVGSSLMLLCFQVHPVGWATYPNVEYVDYIYICWAMA